MDLTTRNAGQGFAWATMGSEAIGAIQDLRWMLVLVILLIIADYRFGCAESKKHHREALKQGNETLSKLTEFRTSRAFRRTLNKFIDYMTLLLVFCLIGLAVTEPYGICSHVITAGIAVVIACICELCSIFGHFLYLRGIELPKFTWKSSFVFIGRVLAGFAKSKDADFGDAIDETITRTLIEEEKKEEKECK